MSLETVPPYHEGQVPDVGDHAVVVGASVAGLLAARVLADGFGRVTVVDRDPLPDEPAPRDGAPQARQPHALQEAGRAVIEDLFPGYGEDVVEAGGLRIDAATDFNFHDEGDYVADAPSRMPMYCASRPLFEHVLRRRVTAVDGVRLRGNHRCVDYLTGENDATVTGVEVRAAGTDERSLAADLVVDATGRTSRTPRWLEAHGFRPPDVDEVTVDLAYSTVTVERDPDRQQAFWAPASAPNTRGGGALPVEGDRWQVVLHGVHGDEPPRDPDGFADFAATLPIDELTGILERRETPSDGVDYYPFPSNLRRRYEDLDRFPDGLVVLGDAVASYNPIYGQGMSVAALHALVLHHALADDGPGTLALRFFDRTESVVDIAWTMAVGADFQFSRTTGPKPRGTDIVGWYLARLTRKCHSDPDLSERFVRVIMMEKRPATLFRPGVAWKVLRPSL